MIRKFNFKTESVASEFAEEVRKSSNREVLLDKCEVTVTSNASYGENESEEKKESLEEKMSSMRFRIDYLWEEMDYMYSYFNRAINETFMIMADHKKGHLPPMRDAGKMTQALNALGWADSFEIEKPKISISRAGKITEYRII